MAEGSMTRVIPPGLINGLLFLTMVVVGGTYIIFSKLNDFGPTAETLVPVFVMLGYALLLAVGRLFRLRDDQSGDNLYYMGFLFTLTSLGVSLYQFSSSGTAEQIVRNFGIAIASTIAGIALRIFFNQMRRDPIEVEQTARLELANASRQVKRELESTVLEFAYFRRATQQSIEDALTEVKELLGQAKNSFVDQLGEFAENSSKPLEEASKKSGMTIDELSTQIASSLDGVVSKIGASAGQISSSAAATAKSLDGIVRKLDSMQTPEQVIEIKLNPAIQGFTRAVNNFGKAAEAQRNAVDEQVNQTRSLVSSVVQLVTELHAAEEARKASAPSAVSEQADQEVPSGPGSNWVPWRRE